MAGKPPPITRAMVRAVAKSGGYGPGGKQPYKAVEDQGGGQAERQWTTDPGANWNPPSANGARQGRPIPNARVTKPKPIPNTRPLRNMTGKNV